MGELFDVQRQNFWTESIHKEAYTRLAWHEKYSKEFARESREGGQAALARRKRPDMVPKVKLIPVQSLKTKKAAAKIDASKAQESSKKEFETLAGKDPNALLVEMRPVTADVREQLFQGFSKEGTGRYAYLQMRKLKKPEMKYEVPLTSSWEYGWRLNDVVKEFRAPTYGRSRIVKDTFFRTNGIL
ncbi:protein SPMIP1-like [Lytechinus pictus]|uniref:protein ATP6V1FNB-like n=1 Tax=Lytechinus variegatus TaxID=7654 RepID=UPI001BB1055D|nr:protein ATP6V1FNB-like [Lytechinus variegatus]XP_054750796.1 protein ATP6V1FNB-like [Lytechinus pictus]